MKVTLCSLCFCLQIVQNLLEIPEREPHLYFTSTGIPNLQAGQITFRSLKQCFQCFRYEETNDNQI
jgi:hypothetical protein